MRKIITSTNAQEIEQKINEEGVLFLAAGHNGKEYFAIIDDALKSATEPEVKVLAEETETLADGRRIVRKKIRRKGAEQAELVAQFFAADGREVSEEDFVPKAIIAAAPETAAQEDDAEIQSRTEVIKNGVHVVETSYKDGRKSVSEDGKERHFDANGQEIEKKAE